MTRLVRLAIVALAAVALSAANASAAPKPKPKPKPINPTRGVVLVTTNLAYEGAAAAGTGIVLTSDGEVLTNNHVIRGATTINVVIPATRQTYTADVVGYDIADDIALLQVNGASKLATATLGDSSKLRLGQFVRAVGNAEGGGKLVITTGVITALKQSITVQTDTGEITRLTGLIQTSARLVPGDSGGPLVDANGKVIGVDAAGSANTAVAADGYAIPINKATSLVRAMRAGISTSNIHIGKTAFLGVTVQVTAQGIVIGSTVPGGAAATAGIEPGDVITALGDNQVGSLADIRAALFPLHPGDTIAVAFVDVTSGQPATTTLTLGEGPPQ